MKVDKVREMQLEELEAKVDEIKEGIFHLRIKRETGQLDRPDTLRELHKDLARVKTVIGEMRRVQMGEKTS